MKRRGNGHEERNTRIMMEMPITDLSRLIGEKWFLPLEKLAEESDVSLSIVIKAVHGNKIGYWSEKKIRRVLNKR